MTSETSPVTQIAKRQTRYKLYFWLMDLCLLFAAFGFLDYILSGPQSWETAPMWYHIFGVITLIFNGLVTPFLIVARFMRDDYAEGLWRRTMVILSLAAATIPAIFIVIDLILQFTLEPSGSWLYRTYYEAWKISAQETDLFNFIATSWLIFVLMFVVVFELLRWKDSR